MPFNYSGLSLRVRLGLCFGTLVSLLAAVVLVSALGFMEFRASSDRLIFQEYPKNVVLDDTRQDLNSIALSMRNTLFLRGESEIRKELDNITISNVRLLDNLKKLHQQFSASTDTGLLKKLDIIDSAYRVNQDDFVALVRQNRMGEARNLLLVDLHPYQLQYFELLNNLQQHQRQRVLADGAAVSTIYQQVKGWTLTLTLIAMLAGLVLTAIMTRSLLRQLGGEPSYAQEVARRIAQGEFSYDIQLQQHDQSSLLAVINQMRNRLNQRSLDLEKANSGLAEVIQTLQQTQHELVESEKMAALGSLVAGVSHELNTPIGNSVIAASTLTDLTQQITTQLRDGQIKRAQLQQYLEEVSTGTDILQRNLSRAADLVASFKQVAVDCSSSQLREFRLGELVRETLLTLRPAFKKLPVEFVQQVPEHICMHSYPGPLTQVITNLVNNAVIHGLSELPQGQVTVAATQISDQEVQITVTDNGRGIPPENMQRIFEPFFTTRLGHGGSGLGLHIVYNNVTQILQGKIRVQSEPGCTVFTLNLPCKITN
ncbi:ATP-binding protein [Undibacterium squillarum]|uniref:histidine kinase n=1 Tax=Undibacterium squillarum TaxID=1131567 RepID=A0ABQ2XVJ0_9BURK|nr:ATP-binding protein [Undibacterium squillarum]GGX35135.1 hypothetical protein GCM10010946_10590 [Undibacterium squillarum]